MLNVDIRYSWKIGLYLEFGREVWARDIHLRIFSIQMAFQVIGLDHTKEVSDHLLSWVS